MALTRRLLLGLGFGAAASALGLVVYENSAKEEPLATDPDSAKFVYRNGVITLVKR